MTDLNLAPACGIYCGECPYLGAPCTGCGKVAGKPFWTQHVPEKICPVHNCCRQTKKLEHCGDCATMPCKTFLDLRDPSMSDEEFTKSLNARQEALKERKKLGTQGWLKAKAGTK